MNDSIVRSGRRESFTVLYNSMITDNRLSLKAKGLFAVMMSRPDDWEFSVSGLAAFTGVGKDSIRNTLAELERVGYLIREQGHNDDGTFAGNVYILQDIAPPLSEKPDNGEMPLSGNPDGGETRQREIPSPGNPTQEKKDLQDIIPPKAPQETKVSHERRRRKRHECKETADWKPERFEAFWTFYRLNVRPENRQGAIRAWDKLQPDDLLIARIGRALEKQIVSESWQAGYGKPHASTYLNGRRWEDVEGLPVQPPPAADAPGRVVETEEVEYL